MLHGVEFKVNGVVKHSFGNFNMIFLPFDIPSAEIKSNNIDIVGGNGEIDATEIDGIVNYKNNKFPLNFEIVKDYGTNWHDVMRELKAFLHGQNAQITIYNNPNYYYEGRCSVNPFKSSGTVGSIVIDVNAKPFQYKKSLTVYRDTIETRKVIKLYNERMETVPTFECSNGMTVEFEGKSYFVDAGKVKVPDIVLKAGSNALTLIGNGNVIITYQEGAL